MSSADWGLVIGGAGLFAASSALPAKEQVAAKVGGAALAAFGGYRIMRSAGRALGNLGDSGGVLDATRGVLFGNGDAQVVKAQTPTSDAIFPPPPHVAGQSGLAGLWGGIVSPRPGSSVRRALFTPRYNVEVEVTNSGPEPWSGVVRLLSQVDFFLGTDERIDESVYVALEPGETQLLPVVMVISKEAVGYWFSLRAPKVSLGMTIGAKYVGKSEFTVC